MLSEPRTFRYKLQPFFIGLLAALLVVACQNDAVRQPTNSQSLDDCRLVQHVMGEVCVPKTPQRLVSLDNVTLADALAVRVSPIGSSFFNQLPDYLTEKIEGMELLGDSEQPNLEKIVRLNPDLIVGLELHGESVFPQLSQIAPTALGQWNGYPSWREHFNFVARVLGKESEAKIVWHNYDRRIEEIQTALGDRLQDIEVSFAYACCGGISIDTENSFSGSIMKDIGIRRPKNQAAVDGGLVILSEERIRDLDADIMFLSIRDDEESKRGLANWQQKPLWNQLKVVQNKQVYLVKNDIWRGGNPIAANLLLDDLEKYLVEKPNKR